MVRYWALILLFIFYPVCADGVEDDIRLLIEDYVVGNEDADVETLLGDLVLLYENPLNINEADRDDLERLPFLSAHQVNALLDYLARYGEVLSLYELYAVYGFNKDLIEDLLPFFCLKAMADTFATKVYGRHEVLLRSTAILERQLGYSQPDSMNCYLGKPYSTLLKYRGRAGDKFLWHVTAEQDKGEPWFQHSKVSDFLSAGIQYQSDGWCRNLVVGDYRLGLGQGLIANNNFAYGKSSQVLDIRQKRQALSPYTSTVEHAMFRGVGLRLQHKSLGLTLGLSNKMVDASLDSVGGKQVIRSFSTSGLHRTSSEVSKYRKAGIRDALVHLDCRLDHLVLGFTVLAQSLDHCYEAENQLYNLHLPHYHNYFNLGLNYAYNHRGLMFFGELATDKQSGLAALQGLTLSPSDRVSFAMLLRHYSSDYYAFYGQAFGEGSRVNNETGFYLGLDLSLSAKWHLKSYFDTYKFPYLRYSASRPSLGHDVLLQPSYRSNDAVSMYWRLKYEVKEETINSSLALKKQLNVRFHIKALLLDYMTLQTRLECVRLPGESNEFGVLIYQDVGGQFWEEKVKVNLRLAHYNISSYDSRIYTYESDVLYHSSVPSFYGKGMRSYFNCAFRLNPSMTFYLKASRSVRFDQDYYGGGLDQIADNHKTDVHLQLRVKL